MAKPKTSKRKSFDIPKRLVWEAFQRVKANGGSAGVDQESIEVFERKLGDNLYRLLNRMGSGSYFPPPGEGRSDPEEDRRHTHVGCAAVMSSGSDRRWVRWEKRTTMLSPRASSPAWSAKCLIEITS